MTESIDQAEMERVSKLGGRRLFLYNRIKDLKILIHLIYFTC